MKLLSDELITIKVEEYYETSTLSECETIWKKTIDTKLHISTNYYDLSVDDKERLLTLMKDWATEELKKVAKIRTNNSPIPQKPTPPSSQLIKEGQDPRKA